MRRWERLDEHAIRGGYRPLVRRTYRLPDGTLGTYEIKQEGPTVAVLAVTSAGDVVLARQFRPGPELVLLELPGGAIDADETPEAAIERELLEETGYAGDVHALGHSFHCAYSTRVSYSFVATGCRKVSEPRPDAHEFIEVVQMPLDAFRDHLASGNLTDAVTAYRGLQYLDLL